VTQPDRDRELRAAFDELRRADERAAPAFDAVLARRRPIDALPAMRIESLRPWSLMAAAAVVFVSIGLIALRFAHPVPRFPRDTDRLTVPSEVVALSAWRPATDVLLETSARTLLTETPQLHASVLDVNP
jgi:hypothetical protein